MNIEIIIIGVFIFILLFIIEELIFDLFGLKKIVISSIVSSSVTKKSITPRPTTTPSDTPPNDTTPNATTPNATTPNATTPNATTPNATTPNATTPSATTPSATTVPQPLLPLVSNPTIPIEGFFRKRINVTGEIPLPNPTDYIICDIPYKGILTSIVIKYTLTTNIQLPEGSKFGIFVFSFVENSGTNLRDIYVDNNPLPYNKVSVINESHEVNVGDIVQITARDFGVSSILKDIVLDLYYDTPPESTNYVTTKAAEERKYYYKNGILSRYPTPPETTPPETTPTSTTPTSTTPPATKVVTTDSITFPIKTTWAVGDKFVVKQPPSLNNTVYRGIITSLPTAEAVNYTAGDGTIITNVISRPLIYFNPNARADNSNGVPETSLLRWT
jgi:hypothetical protein